MAWPDHTDPAYLRSYRHAYYLKHKEKDNRGRTLRKRRARLRQIEYLRSKGLWPIIPEERLYEVPPNIRAIALSKAIKRHVARPKQIRSRPQAEEVLYHYGEG